MSLPLPTLVAEKPCMSASPAVKFVALPFDLRSLRSFLFRFRSVDAAFSDFPSSSRGMELTMAFFTRRLSRLSAKTKVRKNSYLVRRWSLRHVLLPRSDSSGLRSRLRTDFVD